MREAVEFRPAPRNQEIQSRQEGIRENRDTQIGAVCADPEPGSAEVLGSWGNTCPRLWNRSAFISVPYAGRVLNGRGGSPVPTNRMLQFPNCRHCQKLTLYPKTR